MRFSFLKKSKHPFFAKKKKLISNENNTELRCCLRNWLNFLDWLLELWNLQSLILLFGTRKGLRCFGLRYLFRNNQVSLCHLRVYVVLLKNLFYHALGAWYLLKMPISTVARVVFWRKFQMQYTGFKFVPLSIYCAYLRHYCSLDICVTIVHCIECQR